MDETLVLILLALAMFAGCYGSGLIPLVVSLSEEKLQLVSVLGAGLLVGTALAVIIPEGVHTLYLTKTDAKLIHSDEPLTLVGLNSVPQPQPQVHDHVVEGQSMELHLQIGMALVLGFVFMLIVDQIGGSHSRSQESEIGNSKDRSKMTATLGLVVHAAADGVALGAAASTKHTDIEMIVFMAIMLHKAPAAFGLVTFLMHAGLDRARIRRHLLVFALAAPVLALITYFGISQKNKEALTTVNATGIAMLFSAGTFLYVATVHVLPEIASRSSHSHSVLGLDPVDKGLRKSELVALIVGALLPLLLSAGHHH